MSKLRQAMQNCSGRFLLTGVFKMYNSDSDSMHNATSDTMPTNSIVVTIMSEENAVQRIIC